MTKRHKKIKLAKGEQMEVPLTIAEAAKRLQLSTSTIYKYTESGKIPSYKIGKSIRIAESELEQYFLSCKVKKNLEGGLK